MDMDKPRIRFKGYTDAWEQRKLGNICESFEYGLNAAAKEYDGKNKYIRITDIDDSSHEFLQEDVTSPDMDLTGAENYCLKYGDILFARTGASVGKTYIYKDSDGLVYYAGFLIRGRVKDEFVPEFVFQNTLTDDYEKFIRITSQRSGQPGVNAQEYAGYEISMPTYKEQKKIGRYFSNLDRLITLHQRKCEEAKKLKKYMLQNMFPRNGSNVPEIRFDGFTNAWEQRKVKDIAPLQRGFDLPTSQMKEGVYPVVMSNGIGGYHSQYKVKGPGIVTGRSGTIGKLHYIEDDYWPHNTTLWVTDFYGNNQKFIYYMYQCLDLSHFSTGSGVPTLNRNDVHDEVVCIPSVGEQKKISDYLTNLDHLITLHQHKCNELLNIKKFMLEKMFV